MPRQNQAARQPARAVLCLLILQALFAPKALPQEMALPRVVVSSGGPFVARSTAMQTYRGAIHVSAQYASQPLGLLCTNGALSAPGFNWVRMFLVPDQSDQQLQQSGQPIGRMIIDESSFLNSPQQYLNMTGQLSRGENRFIIEAAGQAGATFSWELRSIGPPDLTYVGGPLTAGSEAVLYGGGFSLRANENTVRLGQMYLPVLASSENSLKILVPKTTPPGNYQISVAIRQYSSAPLPATVLPSRQGSD